jgi:hypothetical protein
MQTETMHIESYNTLRLWIRYMVEEAERLKDDDLQAYLEVVQITIEQRLIASAQGQGLRATIRH